MRLRYKIIISIVLVALVLIVFLDRSKLKDVYSKIEDVFRPSEGNKIEEQEPKPSKDNETAWNLTNITNGTGRGGTGGGGEQEEKIPKALTLDIVDICSGKLEDIYTVSEGMRKCLNQKYPYFIILDKNSTHLQTSFYNTTGFNETFLFDNNTLIFYLFAEDVASVSTIIESFDITGNPNFYLGSYDLHTVWESDANWNLYISKMIAILPLYVNNTVTASSGWEELKFYLNIPNKTYYLGDLWIWVK